MKTGRGCRPVSITLLFVFQKAAQALGSAWVAQLAQRLGLDLTYSLARDVELFAHLFQGVIGIHFDTETHAQYFCFARGERVQHFMCRIAQAGI